jgi:TonB family protein
MRLIKQEAKATSVALVPEKAASKPVPKKNPEQRSERKPRKKNPSTPAKPIQGLSASALSTQGTGISAPLGNTLRMEDQGVRAKAEEVGELSGEDLSAEARLQADSISRPSYTDEALDANLQGTVSLDVLVDAEGRVQKVELKKPLGFGMDPLIIAAARGARFIPRKDRFGNAIAGWTEIKFRLELP